jgi:hypothetical protein
MFELSESQMFWFSVVTAGLFVVVPVGAVFYLLLQPERKKTSNPRLQLGDGQDSGNPTSLSQPGGMTLEPTDLRGLGEELETSNTITGGIVTGRKIKVSQRQTSVTEEHTKVIKAAGEQVKTYLQEKNEIDKLRHENDRENVLAPLVKEKHEAELLAEIAKKKYEMEEALKKREDLHKPPPAPEAKKPHDPIAAKIAAKKRKLREGAASRTTLQTAYNQASAELHEELKNDPDGLRVALDALEKEYEEDLRNL